MAENLGQSLGAALGQFAFGGGTKQAGMKGMLDGAHAAAYDATAKRGLAEALKAEAEAAQLREQSEARRPENIFRGALTQHAIPSEDAQAVEQWQRTGQLGGRYAPSIDGMGPTAPQPDWARNLPALGRTIATTQRALTLGDKSVENAAKADAIGRESALGDDIIAGRLDPLKVTQSQFALKGNAPFQFHEYGTGNLLTGKLDETTGAATRLGDKRVAETAAQKANARQSDAAADASRASAKKYEAETKKVEQETADGAVGPGRGGPVLGVPVPTVLPWANQSNPKDANKVKAKEIERGGKEIEKDVDAARKEDATAQAAARFLELNKNVATGGVTDKFGVGRWVNSMGSDYAEMEAITAKLAPGMREPGSGSTSDFDGKQFERATVGVDKPKATNENIARAMIARAQQSKDYADFRQTYLEQNGTLQGADRYWKEYVNANPIFDKTKPGSYELNRDRKNWAEHFKGGKAAAPPATPTAPQVLKFDANGNPI